MDILKELFLFSAFLILILHVDINGAISGPTHNKVVVCYIGTWSVYRPSRGKFDIEDLDPSLCTHVIYSFAGLNSTDDTIRALDPWQDLSDDYGKDGYNRLVRLKQEYPHLKVSIAIGGWNEGSTNYSRLAADPARRGRFIVSVLNLLRKHQFDGLDLDWEFPAKRGGIPQDKANFLLLVKELRAAFNKFNYLLTAAFGAGKDTIDIAYDVAGLSVYLDFIHMMCYDYHGAWDSKTGANAPLRSSDVLNVEYSINYMLKLGADPSKLVMGVPFYGRTFLVGNTALSSVRERKLGESSESTGFQGPFTKEDGFMGYHEICLELKNTSLGYTRYWDSDSQTPFAVSGQKVITYDDPESLTEKIKFAMEKGLAGCMIWSIDTDDFRGDCADDDSNVNGHSNYPLLRTVNKAIEQTLEDIERNKINVIPHGETQDDTNNTAMKNNMNYIFVLTLSVIIKIVYCQLI
ncbi:Glycosyl hydrolases family 18 [Popillia japonica]|uniref:Glycosyl hydrolases family 18 n=1 Tax=Popillia japonica TaxID=7064 RepID=A0AAW1NN35_POPJA